MITYSIIQKSQLEDAQRIDAQYFQPEYLEYEEAIFKTGKYKKWNELHGKFITGPFGSEFDTSNYEENGKYRYVRGKDVRPFFLLGNDNVYVPEAAFEKLKKYSLKEDDILISVVGTLGYTAIVDQKTVPGIFSCKSTIFRSEGEINPYYLIAYLNSKYGYSLLIRKERGANQTGLNIEDLKTLSLFIPSNDAQNKIGLLVIDSRQVLEDSVSYYTQAENLLLEELGLKDFKIKDDLFFVVNVSDVKSENRSDSDFFQPKYEDLIKRLQEKQLDSLETNFEMIKSKNFEYNNEGEVGVIKTKQLGQRFISFEVEDKTREEIVKKENLPLLVDSDVVFASMGVGSLGKTNIYYDFEFSGKYTIDSTLRIFRKKNSGKVLPEVLDVYLNSRIGQELIYKYVVGSSGIISIYETYLQNFLIPILPTEVQQKIAELVRKSHEARKKSKELLEMAKRKVEEMILGGES